MGDSEQAAWKPLGGLCSQLSYGNGKMFVVPHEVVGARCRVVCAHSDSRPSRPESFAVGSTRSTATFTLADCSPGPAIATQPGGFYRVRTTGKPIVRARRLSRAPRRLAITFTGPLATRKRPDRLRIHGQDLVAQADGQLRI